ncbi:deleted in malignant brain tumors 1 protein-like [Synchiropus splendidus]|uniref:deleted in malignant brain tumors 1 protein-like n=1 Tax=Synchiropus splendidus TaxID=270530 RepID=UPI00237D6785|nr:deleted in malignant brain tumors 1 protein-like [Synchiropus splendidus]
MGSCSCSSSCQYYGNCCHDFHWYCSTTTEDPWVTPAPSCRYNCGSHMGSCSCSSSCEYYGNCCRDYHWYCPSTTDIPWWPTTAPTCGGYLYGGGTFTSPNHPHHYDDNSRCEWHLRVPRDSRIFLRFTFLELENCCSCDYISVYNGNSIGHPYLGRVCNGSVRTFQSTSHEMTVVFRTDSSVVARGFTAEYHSILSPNSGSVDCSSSTMTIVLQKNYLQSLGYEAHNLFLNDRSCRPRENPWDVVFSFPIHTCGNIQTFQNSSAIYSNTLRAFPSSSGDGVITHHDFFRLNITCLMAQESESHIMYIVNHNQNSSIIGTGMFNTSMDFYTSSSFYYKVTESPYEVNLNQYMYVQINLDYYDSKLVVYIDTCVASPSPTDFENRAHYLVRNG